MVLYITIYFDVSCNSLQFFLLRDIFWLILKPSFSNQQRKGSLMTLGTVVLTHMCLFVYVCHVIKLLYLLTDLHETSYDLVTRDEMGLWNIRLSRG